MDFNEFREVSVVVYKLNLRTDYPEAETEHMHKPSSLRSE